MTENCSICLNPFDYNITSTHCNHKFHEECLKKWYKISKSCPLCRSSQYVYNILIQYIYKNINKHYIIKDLFFKNNKSFIIKRLINQPPQAWLNFYGNNSFLPLYTLRIKKRNKFISYYTRQLMLWEKVYKEYLVYLRDDNDILYISSEQPFKNCLLNKGIVQILTEWLFELLHGLKNIYNIIYHITWNTFILDFTIAYIVKSKLTNTSKYQLILITCVYNCLKFYIENKIIKFENFCEENLKDKLIWFTNNSCKWDEELEKNIYKMIKSNTSCCG